MNIFWCKRKSGKIQLEKWKSPSTNGTFLIRIIAFSVYLSQAELMNDMNFWLVAEGLFIWANVKAWQLTQFTSYCKHTFILPTLLSPRCHYTGPRNLQLRLELDINYWISFLSSRKKKLLEHNDIEVSGEFKLYNINNFSTFNGQLHADDMNVFVIQMYALHKLRPHSRGGN